MSRFNSQCGTFISVCDQPPRTTQPGHPFVGEYQPKDDDASWLGVKAGMVRTWVAGKTVGSLCYTRIISDRFRHVVWWSAIQMHITLLYVLICVYVDSFSWPHLYTSEGNKLPVLILQTASVVCPSVCILLSSLGTLSPLLWYSPQTLEQFECLHKTSLKHCAIVNVIHIFCCFYMT